MGYAGNGLRVAAAMILLVIGFSAPVAGARPVIKGTKRADRLSGRGAAETIKGGRGDDRLSGGGGSDLLLGGPGGDRLTGGAGLDDLRGQSGNDVLSARDGKADRVNCGPGKDRAIVDSLDAPIRGCERIERNRSAAPKDPARPFDLPRESELIAAGDIADCTPPAEQTAQLVDRLSGVVAVPGDAVYEVGALQEYMSCYAPTWGRHKWRTRPAVGDHDYRTPGAAGFFTYFGAAAGVPGLGWYSYEIGSWHVVVLNTACDQIGGCGPGSPQEAWLRADLAAHPTRCSVAYWHTPLFSSGSHGGIAAVKPLFQALYDHGVELVLSGNDHDYERFAPQNADGGLDQDRGVRQFVVGTGGRYLRPLDAVHHPNSEAASDSTFGVLALDLDALGYDWRFVPVAGSSFTDSGSGTCH